MSQTMEATASQFSELLDREQLTDRLVAMVREPSENPPGEEARVGELVASQCQDLELDVEVHELETGRPNVVARWGSGKRVVGYCSHFDVIPAGDHKLWEQDPYGAKIIDGRMHGRGTSDAKGPIAAALEAVAILRRAGFAPDGTLELAFVSDEETMGFIGAGYLVEQRLVRPDVAIVGEPTSLRVVHAQRGACWFQITTRGLAGHGSAPERGRSAIKHMAEIISHLETSLPRVNHEVLGGPSINAGTIHGGTKVNVVPASCVVEVDRRSVPPETRESVIESVEAAVERASKRFPDIDASVELQFYGEPFVLDVGARLVQDVAAATGAATGRPPELIGFRGASDARYLAQAGADVVVCGPGDISLAHTARESIDLEELERAAVAYALAFERLLGPAS